MENNQEFSKSRRGFIKKMAFVPPAIVTLSAIPSIASAGSPRHRTRGNNGVGNGPDNLPNGLSSNGRSYLDNDDDGGIPGNPQNRGGHR